MIAAGEAAAGVGAAVTDRIGLCDWEVEPRRAKTYLFSGLPGQLDIQRTTSLGGGGQVSKRRCWPLSAEIRKDPTRISYTSDGLPILESVAW